MESVCVRPAVPDASLETLPFGGDEWTLIAEGASAELAQTPALFVLGNGFIGLRGPGESETAPRVYLNGVFEKMPIAYHEAAHGYARFSDTRLAVADATRLAIAVDGVPVTGCGSLELAMRRGLLIQTIAHGDVIIRIERLVSMERTGLVAARVKVWSHDAPAQVTIRSIVSPPPFGNHSDGPDDVAYDPRLGPEFTRNPWCAEGATVASGQIGRVDRLRESGFLVAALASKIDVTLTATANPVVVECFSLYHAAREMAPMALLADAETALQAATATGFSAIADEQVGWFERFWEQAWIALPDAPVAERAMRHGLFQLVQAVGRDGATSLAAKGQSGEGYEGHVFWDAESYALPVFAYTQPAIARAMLAWRIAALDDARANARSMGHSRGALYPWRTIAGRECSSFFPAGAAQYHINADIAYALKLYIETTGDRSILADGGAEMLAETARIWLQIGYHDQARGGGFVINSVTGPDEYSALVDNNLFTNMLAAEHLRYAVAVAGDQLDAREAAAMTRAADSMVLPFDNERGIPAQDERFFARQPWAFEETPAENYPLLISYHPLVIYRHRVAKQADAVLAMVMLRESFAPEVRARMLDAYESVTVHDSTLSASSFATAAANIGDAARAFTYWRVSVLTDLENLFGNSDHGLHMAALAGGWNGLALGFAGMRTINGVLSFAPIAVPALGRYAFRVHYHGQTVELAVDGTSASYRLIAGEPLKLWHGDEQINLTADEPAERAL